MKKLVFIIPYFGEFNNYFQLFLNSCATNKEYDWLIFTDNKQEYSYPTNVHVNNMKLEDVKSIIEKKLGFNVVLHRGYKLCDYKPAYGYIFEEYINDYEYWGHCDTDLIFGDLSKYLEDKEIEGYDKLFFLGHCTIYKNNIENNRRFMLKLGGKERYKEVFQNKKIYAFDEEFNQSINNIYEDYKLPVLKEEFEANMYAKTSNLKITRYDFKESKYIVEKKTKSFFVWDNGKLFRYIYKDGKLQKEEYMYIHLQLRKMQLKLNDIYSKKYKIIPNAFEELEVETIDNNNFSKVKKKNFNIHYFKIRIKGLIMKVYDCCHK